MSGTTNKDKKEDAQSASKSDKKEEITDPNVPDRSYGDYFCPICDSHMNSDAMWEAHITGKRHIKNLKKGDSDSKYEDLDDVESNIKYELRNVKDPIIGLSYIHEIRRREPNVPPMYNCFLCHASIATVPLVIEHVISLKHRLNYMKENAQEEYDLLDATNLKKGHMEPLVHEAAIKMEQKFGRGTVKVKKEKPKPVATWPYKRNSDDDYDDKPWKQPKIEKTDKSSNNWKSTDATKKSSSRRGRSISPRDHRDQKRTPYSDDDEFSMDGYKRSSSIRKDLSPRRDDYRKKDLSPRRDDYHRKDISPRRDDYHRKDLLPKRDDYRDDYHRSYSKSFDYDSRKYEYDHHLTPSCSREKSPYNMPPEYGRAGAYSQELARKDAYSARNTSNEYYPADRSGPSKDDYLLPHERIVSNPDPISDTSMVTDLFEKILALPTGVFLKIVAHKMQTIELKGIEELDTLSKIINTAQVVLCSKLPPDAIAILRQKISQNSESSVQKNIPKMEPPMRSSAVMSNATVMSVQQFASNQLSRPSNSQQGQSSLNFIRDILNSAKSYNSTPASNQLLNSYQSANPQQTQSMNPQQTQSMNPQQTQSMNPQQTQNVNQHPTQNVSPHQQQTPNLNQSQYATYMNNQYPNTSLPYQSNSASGSVPSFSNLQPSTTCNIPGLTLTEQTPQPQGYNFKAYTNPPPINKNYPYRYQ